jgi:hypothetical protein
MPLKYAQLLSTAHYVLDGKQVGYAPTHKNHPSAIWVRKSVNNYNWLYLLFCNVSHEYKYRYHKTHKSFSDFKDVLIKPPKNIPIDYFTLPTPLMPPECLVEGDVIQSYRNYYNTRKRHLHAWFGRPNPPWITEDYPPHYDTVEDEED